MTRYLGLRHLAFGLFLVTLVLVAQNLRIGPAIVALQRPMPLFAEAGEPANASETTPEDHWADAAPVSAQVRADLPEVDMPLPDEPAALPEPVATVFPDMPEGADIALAAAAPGAAAAVDPVEEPAALEGTQEGRDVPAIGFESLTRAQIARLIAARDMVLWLETGTGRRMWFVPGAGGGGPGLAELAEAGRMVGDPLAAGLEVATHDGGRLRELRVEGNAAYLPFFLFVGTAARTAGAVDLARGGLRISPDLEARIVDAQQQALASMGFAGNRADDWPRTMRMYACWQDDGQVVITRTEDGTTGAILHKGPTCDG